MTNLTMNGIPTTNTLGQEQYETFTSKVGRKAKRYVSYDYRHTDGELFSCVKQKLGQCRAARDAWLVNKGV